MQKTTSVFLFLPFESGVKDMAQAAEVLSINSNTSNTAAQPGWWSRNKSWAAPTAAFAGGVAVGVGAVKAYDYLTGSDDVAAPAQTKTATK